MKNKSPNPTFQHVLFFFVLIMSMSFLVINSTTRDQALLSDANSYLKVSQQIKDEPLRTLFQSNFIDLGYPIILSIITPQQEIVYAQHLNYLMWFFSVCLIYFSLRRFISIEKSFQTGFIMAVSTTFLSFSFKIYSETLAALGVSLLIYYFAHSATENKFKLTALFLGSLILFTVKTVFILFLPIILGIIIYLRKTKAVPVLLLAVIFISINFISASKGNRGNYNIAIQTSKLSQPYGTIFACSVYYLSYPLGQRLLPQYQGACHQNNPTSNMARYNQNPYIIADYKRGKGFNLTTAANDILRAPIKYGLVVTCSMFSAVFFDSPTALASSLNPSLLPVVWVLTKTISLLIWYLVISHLILIRDKKILLLCLSPLIYFILIVGNFPVEQRYFYPLIPWLYFMSAVKFPQHI